MIIPIQSRRRGLGSGAGTADLAVSTGGAIAVAAAPSLIGAEAAAVAIPIIGIGVAAVTLAIGLFLSRKGPAQKIATTKVANYYEPLFQQNLQAYRDGPHTVSSRARALANFDALWSDLKDNCETAANGDPGVRCVTDRQAGACTWQDEAGCWNWFSGYRDPIANDANVVADPTPAAQLLTAGDSVLSAVFPTATASQRSLYFTVGTFAAAALIATFAFGGD